MVQLALWFGIAAGVFFFAVVTWLWFAATRGNFSSPYYLLPPVHALIAGGAYALMSLAVLGSLPAMLDVSLIRHADWALSTPIITYYLSMLAGTDQAVRALAVVANVLIIVLGYVSLLVSGSFQWVFFAAASVLFLVLIYMYVRTFGSAIRENPQTSRSLFRSLRDLTILIWSLYPIVYLLGPSGAGLLTAADHSFVIIFLDLTAKVGFMGVMGFRQYELNTFVSADTTASAD